MAEALPPADDNGFGVFLAAAMKTFARQTALTAHGWTPEQRAGVAELDAAQIREVFDGWARQAIKDIVPGGIFTPTQVESAVSDISAIGVNVITAALKVEPGAWVMTCCGCFHAFEAEVIAGGDPKKFEPPLDWFCIECAARCVVEVGLA